MPAADRRRYWGVMVDADVSDGGSRLSGQLVDRPLGHAPLGYIDIVSMVIVTMVHEEAT